MVGCSFSDFYFFFERNSITPELLALGLTTLAVLILYAIHCATRKRVGGEGALPPSQSSRSAQRLQELTEKVRNEPPRVTPDAVLKGLQKKQQTKGVPGSRAKTPQRKQGVLGAPAVTQRTTTVKRVERTYAPVPAPAPVYDSGYDDAPVIVPIIINEPYVAPPADDTPSFRSGGGGDYGGGGASSSWDDSSSSSSSSCSSSDYSSSSSDSYSSSCSSSD